jgi:hypothetical protein
MYYKFRDEKVDLILNKKENCRNFFKKQNKDKVNKNTLKIFENNNDNNINIIKE